MKTATKFTIILFLLIGSIFLKAEEVIIPVINRPSVLEEGIQKELTAAQMAELLPWAKDSKLFLTDLLDNTQGLPTIEKIERLIDGIKQVVGESAPKNSELFMRYVLNRALVLYELLEKEMEASAVGTADAKSRILVLSIKMAIKYYDVDREKLTNNKNNAPYASFGIEYFNFLTELNKSIFDASAEYNILRTSLEWLQWDFYRDLNNVSYASKILKINNALKTFPSKKFSDVQSINYIRQMKKVVLQLEVLSKSSGPSEKYSNPTSEKYKSKKTVCYAMSTTGDYLKEVHWSYCSNNTYQSYGSTCYALSFNGEFLKPVHYTNCMSK